MRDSILSIIQAASRVVLDKENEFRFCLASLLAGGHVLIEDVPGVGKTTFVQTLGRLMGLETKRIQFTVDLLPSDILGNQVFHPVDQSFRFHPGPLFSQLVMADELNRASPRTQGALLQAMEEGVVTIDGETRSLPRPFHVIATQNPHQQVGTFPLPESQLDRFLMSLELNYASRATEMRLFQTLDPRHQLEFLKPMLSPDDLLQMQKAVMAVKVSEVVAQYIADLLERSRKGSGAALPLSTRSGLALVRAAKAWAFMEGRDFVHPQDVQKVLVPVFGHRMGGRHGLRNGREWAQSLQSETPVPL